MSAPTSVGARALVIALALVASFEGLRLAAYIDPVGIPTACFGTTAGVQLGQTYTLEQCRELLGEELQDALDIVDRCAGSTVLTENQRAAFGSAVYNLGPRVVCGPGSTLAVYLRAGRVAEACHQLVRWDKARVAGQLVALPGLTRRRAAERDLCLLQEAA